MSRIKRSVSSRKRRKYLLQRAKGYINAGSTSFRQAKERLLKAEKNMYKSRRLEKRDFRSLWITRINGALDQIGSEMSYSVFIDKLNKSGSKLNRKVISELAIANINDFKNLVESLK
jgi:large subunit ribosomal protein L20